MTTRAKLHTAWSSVLIDSTITGALTISRNSVVVAVIAEGQLVWYDHFPPLGVSLTYSVTNGTTTKTAVITVPARTDGKTWLKSGVDPNLSIAVLQRPLQPVVRSPRAGVYYPASANAAGGPVLPWITFGGITATSTQIVCDVDQTVDRAKVPDLLAGPVYYQPPAATFETPRWGAVVSGDISEQSSEATPLWWDVSFTLTETPAPAVDTSRQVIPGWSWTDVATVYASWTATAAAQATWVDLVRFGVT